MKKRYIKPVAEILELEEEMELLQGSINPNSTLGAMWSSAHDNTDETIDFADEDDYDY